MALFEKKNEVKSGKREKTSFGMALANKVLIAPRITEKSFILSERGEYTFRVALGATKQEVKRSVEEAYGVHVEAVRTITIPSRKRAFGRTIGMQAKMKKAIVKLRTGESIEMFKSGVAA
jgi:large subunit ribosomal protein L23